MSGDPTDEHGAQTKYLVGFKNVHIDGVEFTNVGQVCQQKKKEKEKNDF